MNHKSTRVLIAEDHIKVREGIRNLLESSPEIRVVGEAGDGVEALKLVEELSPDVLVLDVEMPRLNGRQVAAQLKQKESAVKILVLSSYDDKQYISGMLSSGVAGYLKKDEAPSILVKAVQSVAKGEKGWFSRQIASKISNLNSSAAKS